MTNKQMVNALRRAKASLARTTQSGKQFAKTGRGSEWSQAYAAIDKVIAALGPPPKPKVPALGPVTPGGKSVLDHDLTHSTSGLALYPAFDDVFREGAPVIAPEYLIVTRDSSSHPGDAFYAEGRSGLRYWFGHLRLAPKVGNAFAKGAVMGHVGPNSIGGGPHVHVGVNIEKIAGAGHELAHHTNYTHGAPTIGAQLTALLGGR